jgi:hypothetical protein
VNLKKGLPSLAPGPENLAGMRQNGQTTQVAERNGSSGRFGKGGWFAKKTASGQLHTICVGGSLWAIWGG